MRKIKDGTAIICSLSNGCFFSDKEVINIDLYNYAIILIYPDGNMEKVSIGNSIYHLDYLKELLITSNKFRNACLTLDFNNLVNHFSVDKILNEQGIITIYNNGIEDIIKNPNIRRKDLAIFHILTPFEFESLSQVLKFQDILNYPKEKLLNFNLFMSNNFVETDYDTIKNLVEDSKIILLEKRKR